MKHSLLNNLKLFFFFTASSFFYNISLGQSPPNLGAASSFALFTAVGAFSNIGEATYVIGDVGTNAGAFNAFPPGTVVGQIHVADATSAQAATDVDVAYSYLSGITCDSVIGTTLGNNQVLTPKVYCLGAASTLNGDLILDGQGDPDALFIFKIDGALSTSTFSNVVLINSASLCNVYWQINGAFSLGDSSVFRGTIVANGAISLLEGSSLLGKGLSRAGAIDLHNNYVAIGMQPIVTITASGNTTLCLGDSVTLTASVSNGDSLVTFIWSPGGQTDSFITVSPTVTTSYIVTVTTGNGCSDAIDTIVVTVNPSVTIIGPDFLCVGDSITLTASMGGTVVWSTGDTTQAITVTTAGEFFVTVTDSSGCITSDTVVVTVNPPVTIIGPDFLCVGDSITLTASTEGSLVWSTGDTTLSITVTTAGEFFVTVTDSSGCITSDTVVVTVNPPVTIIGPVTLCVGDSITLTASIEGSLVWSTGDTTQSIIFTTGGEFIVTVTDSSGCTTSDTIVITVNPPVTIIGSVTLCVGDSITLTASIEGDIVWSTGDTTQSITVTTGGEFIVTVTDSSDCTTSDTIVVTVNPSVTIIGSVSFCEGDSITLTASIGGAVIWSTGDTTQSITITTATVTTGGGFFVTVTDSSGCTTSDTIVITVNPSGTIIGPDFLCEGDSITLTASIEGSLVWSTGDTTQSITVTTGGEFFVTFIDSNSCITSDTIVIIVNSPIVNLGPDTIQCGGIVLLDAGNAGATFLWNTGDSTQTLVVSSTGIYSVTVTNSFGCSASDTIQVTINPLPLIEIIVNGPTNLCLVDSVILTASVGSSIVWSTGDTTQSITVTTAGEFFATVTDSLGCSASDTIEVTRFLVDLGADTTVCGCILLDAGNPGASFTWCNGAEYQTLLVCTTGVYCVTVDNDICIDSDTIFVTISPAPIVNLGPDTTVTGSLLLDAGNVGATFLWSTGDTTQMITVNITGTYFVTVTDTSGCSASDTIDITVPTGINYISWNQNFKIYPNPSNGNFIISADKAQTLILTNTIGQIMQTIKLHEDNNNTVKVEGIQSGIYFLISSTDALLKYKIVIAK